MTNEELREKFTYETLAGLTRTGEYIDGDRVDLQWELAVEWAERSEENMNHFLEFGTTEPEKFEEWKARKYGGEQ